VTRAVGSRQLVLEPRQPEVLRATHWLCWRWLFEPPVKGASIRGEGVSLERKFSMLSREFPRLLTASPSCSPKLNASLIYSNLRTSWACTGARCPWESQDLSFFRHPQTQEVLTLLKLNIPSICSNSPPLELVEIRKSPSWNATASYPCPW